MLAHLSWDVSPAWGHRWCGCIHLPHGAALGRCLNAEFARAPWVCPQPPGTALFLFILMMSQKPHLLHHFILAQPEIKGEQTLWGQEGAQNPTGGFCSSSQLLLQLLLTSQPVPAPNHTPLVWHNPTADPHGPSLASATRDERCKPQEKVDGMLTRHRKLHHHEDDEDDEDEERRSTMHGAGLGFRAPHRAVVSSRFSQNLCQSRNQQEAPTSSC